jgi:hypothetical protein
MSDPTPAMQEVPGVEPTFTAFDDVKWQHVRTQRHADGQQTSVREKWFAIGREPQYLSMLGRWDPGMIVHRHGHNSHQVVYVLAGGMWCGERWCPAGTHIDLPLGAALGPLIAGPDGVDLFEVMMGDPRSWEADREGFHTLLAERGVTPLPNPPVDLPDWLEDKRSHH